MQPNRGEAQRREAQKLEAMRRAAAQRVAAKPGAKRPAPAKAGAGRAVAGKAAAAKLGAAKPGGGAKLKTPLLALAAVLAISVAGATIWRKTHPPEPTAEELAQRDDAPHSIAAPPGGLMGLLPENARPAAATAQPVVDRRARKRPAPHPAAREATLQSEADAWFDFQEKYLVEAYEDGGHRDLRWDADALALLEGATYLPAGGEEEFVFWSRDRRPRAADLVPVARRVVTSGCDDPVVLWKAAMLLRAEAGASAETRDALSDASDKIEASPYIAAVKARVALDCDACYGETTPGPSGSAGFRMAKSNPLPSAPRVAKLLKAAMSDASVLPARRREVRKMLAADLFNEASVKLAAAMGEVPAGADAWVAHELMGRLEIARAMDARLSAPGQEMTPEQERACAGFLGVAADHFAKAIAADPKLPEPYAEMSTVSMIRGTGSTDGFEWFQKAVAREPDFGMAYRLYAEAAQPDWGGSAGAMYQGGVQALATARFDTAAPAFLINALDAMEAAHLSLDRRAIATLYPGIVNCLDGYLNNNRDPAVQAWARNQRLLWAARNDDWAAAYAQVDAMRAAKVGLDDAMFAAHALTAADVARKAVFDAGPHADAIRDAMAQPTPAARADALAALVKSLPAADASRPALEAQRDAVAFDAKLRTGEWAHVPLGANFPGWAGRSGTWTPSEAGDSITVTPAADGGFSIGLNDGLPGSFEVRLKVRPLPMEAGRKPDGASAFAIRPAEAKSGNSDTQMMRSFIQALPGGAYPPGFTLRPSGEGCVYNWGRSANARVAPGADGFFSLDVRITPTSVALLADAQGKERSIDSIELRSGTLILDSTSSRAPGKWELRDLEIRRVEATK